MTGLSKVLIAIGTGLAVGATLGVLFAPDEGVETRKRIMKKGKKLVGLVNDSIEDGRESAQEIKEVLQQQLAKVNRRLNDISI